MRRFCLHRYQRNCLLLLTTLVVSLAGASGCNTVTATPDAATPVSSPTRIPTATYTPVPLPTATVEPSPTATKRPSVAAVPTICPDAMLSVLQLEPDVGDPSVPAAVPAGDIVHAGWRIKNVGSCIWDTSYLVQFSEPQNPGWVNSLPPTRLPKSIRPGETMDVWVEAVAPLMNGIQTAQWELLNGRGERVGDPLTLTIETAALPTSDRRPERWFDVYPEAIQPGERAALSWSMQNAKAVYLDGPGISGSSSPLETTASRYVFPSRTSKYELEVVNSDDSIDRFSVTVVVEPYLPPRIRTFEIEAVETASGCFQLSWTTENRVNRVVIYRNGEIIWDGVIDDGVIRDCPPGGSASYILIISGPGGTDTDTLSTD